MTPDDYQQQADRVRAIPNAAERKAALGVLADTIRRIAWSVHRQQEARALVDVLRREADAIDADPLAGLDSLAARGALEPR